MSTTILISCALVPAALITWWWAEKVRQLNFRLSFEKKTASSSTTTPSWLERNLTRDVGFISRYAHSHLWVKARKSMHGLCGLTLWVSEIFGILAVFSSNEYFSDICKKVHFVASFGLLVGIYTPYMYKKVQKYGKFTGAMTQYAFLLLAMGTQLVTIYGKQTPVFSNEPSMHFLEVSAIALSLGSSLVSLGIYVDMLKNQLVWAGRTSAIGYFSTIPLIWAPFVYQLLYGSDALVELYQTYRIADTLAVVILAGCFCTSVIEFLTTVVLRKGLSLEQLFRVAPRMWLTYGFSSLLLIAIWCDVRISVAYAMIVGLDAPFRLFIQPEWVYDKVEENRKALGVIVHENQMKSRT